MSNGLLIDFNTCLRYSIFTGRSFLCLVNQIDEEESSSDIYSTRFSDNSSSVFINTNTASIESVKNAVILHCKNENVNANINIYNPDDIKNNNENRRDASEIPNSSNVPQINTKNTGSTSSNNTKDSSSSVEISIIPDINSFTDDDEKKLVDKMTSNLYEQTKTASINFRRRLQNKIYIGIVMVPSLFDNPLIDLNNTSDLLSSCITIQNWLKQKFWLACTEPDTEAVNQQGLTSLISNPFSTSNNSFATVEKNSNDSSNSINNINNTGIEFDLEKAISVTPVVRRYIMDLMIQVRNHRFTHHSSGGGASTSALKALLELARMISLSKNKTFVTPRDVKLAACWYFPSHINIITDSSMDSSILYGSKPDLVDELLSIFAKLKLKQNTKKSTSKINNDIKYQNFNNTEEIVDYELNPLFLEYWVIRDVISKVVPPV
ncbi:hypothetical protein TBLA_0B05580 [Henningerozyma blattae CBS 6284]|uniref:Magnesium chelatase n=1 Tax=Henningerozyma blattae (strain ATCC 34711 / CBS 6284 / DSM 70876 / NBRC 10599 / NRRL Y-10934 / UCD 77-7) TaxID=1071380 RepID=I2GZ34_HENB6|nr:hypothetical protein TBLA_0B05580 [Tetrapisispora blattae CBS 6284]CCH59386.1 hypothetical protein TBLA_0B05580 [Tetrapisispora blattae CBS 6284]